MKRKASSYGGVAKRRRTMRRRMRRGPPRRGRRGRRQNKVVYAKVLRQPVPDKMYTQLNYCETLALNMVGQGSAGRDYQSFRTSIYDPNSAGVGHQPLWRDQMALLYKTYKVHGFRYVLTFMNTNTSQLAMITLQHASTGPEGPAIDIDTIRERRGVRTFSLGSSGDRPKVVKGFLRTGTPWGLTKRETDYDDYFEADMGANPVKQSYLNIYGTTQNTSAIVNMHVKLTFYVELMNRVQISGS